MQEKTSKYLPHLGTKRIRTWPYLTLPWVTRCPNMPLCLISLFTFYFLGDIPFHPLPLLLKWTMLWIWTPQPFGRRSFAKRVVLLRRVMPMTMENLSIAQHQNTLRYAHTRSGSCKPKVRQFDVGDFEYL
jgi:hypothetical protein